VIFLSQEELRILTGRARRSTQIDALRAMGIAFWVNAAGRPVVAKAAIEGRAVAIQAETPETWHPAVLKRAA
jgi:hypothetical protein